jgi:N-acetylglucosamine kinase-like BadF-type ATPase
MRFVLGIDGGGTKTDCVLMDESLHVVAQSRGGPSNPLRVGFGGALAAVCEAARNAIQSAKVASEDVRAIAAGLAGTGNSEAERKMKRLLEAEFPGKTVQVCTDLELTLEAIGEGPAVVLIAGTGSAAVGRDTRGQIARVGGRGPLLGDEGSAYDIGRKAALVELRHYDRTGNLSPLAVQILGAVGETTWAGFQSRAYAIPDEVFPKIFPVIVEAAETGNSAARQLLQEAAHDLAGLVTDVVERLGLRQQNFLLVKSGGILGRCAYFDEQIDQRLRQAAPQAKLGALSLTPSEAAARMALRLLPHAATEGM